MKSVMIHNIERNINSNREIRINKGFILSMS